MASMDTFKTVVRNTSGIARHFSFLPPHGKDLAVNGDFVWNGDLTGYLAKDTRAFTAFKAAITDGSLTILQTPTCVQYDAGAARTKHLYLNNSAAQSTNPPEGSYAGAAPTY